MKNIHVLPTDKPSRGLVLFNGTYRIEKGLMNYPKDLYPSSQGYDIYITSDEEIKDGNYVFVQGNEEWSSKIWKKIPFGYETLKGETCMYDGNHFKKIILTTDQDLIKDGVQSIPDEFLEWFVNNPSCEEIEVLDLYGKNLTLNKLATYKIIIPKEEPNIIDKWLEENGNPEVTNQVEEEAEDILLEEAFDSIYKELDFSEFDFSSFKLGAKWQQQKSNQEIAMWKAAVEKQKQRCIALRQISVNLKETMFTYEDMLLAAEYGYSFHKTTQFPEQEFKDSCIRNTQQWLTTFKKKR